MPVSFHIFRDFGLLVGFLGAFGILVNKRHILLSMICMERRFYGINFFLVALSVYLDDRLGEIFALFVLTLAAAESALALALLTAYFRVYGNILLREDLFWSMYRSTVNSRFSFPTVSFNSTTYSCKVCFSTSSKNTNNPIKLNSNTQIEFEHIVSRFPNTFFYAIHGE